MPDRAPKIPLTYIQAGEMARETGLIFLHVPKTAGLTLRSIIRRQYPPGVIVDAPPTGLVEMTAEERARVRVILGHVPFGTHSQMSVPARYVTMLRNPVDRVVSLYYHLLGKPQNLHHPWVRGRSLEEYAASAHPQAMNHQTQLLSGHTAGLEAGSLDAARQTLLHHVACCGVNERFDESLLLFKHALGWRNVFYLRENVSSVRPALSAIPASTIRVIERNNELDAELYSFAARQLDATLEAQPEAFWRELHRFRRINRVYGAVAAGSRRCWNRIPARLREAARGRSFRQA